MARVSPNSRYGLRHVWRPDDRSPAARGMEVLGCQMLVADDAELTVSS